MKNKKKLRSGAMLRSDGDAKQVIDFMWPNYEKNGNGSDQPTLRIIFERFVTTEVIFK